MITLQLHQRPAVLTSEQTAYIARFALLAGNIVHWCEHDHDYSRERRNLHRLWKIADTKPAHVAARLCQILHDVCPWIES